MIYVIAEPCVGVKDGACTQVCPVDCIHPLPGAAAHAEAPQLYINPDECIGCGVCVDECPVGAIFAEEDVPAEWSEYVQINAAHFRERRRTA